MRWLVYSLVVVEAVLVAGCGAGDANLILTGGLIWTDPATPISGPEAPTAIAARDGRVMAIGTDSAIAELAGAGTESISLEGRRVVPGFMDNHAHFISGGYRLAGVQLRAAQTPQEFARRIGAFAAEHPDEWILGGQWDHELWGGGLPRRDWVDSLTRRTPIFVRRLDGHMGREAIARFAAEEVVASVQPYHAIDDGRWAGKRIGPERIKTTYAFRSLLDAGAWLTFGSDWTVAPLDPLLGIYAAVTRRTIEGANPGGWVSRGEDHGGRGGHSLHGGERRLVFCGRRCGNARTRQVRGSRGAIARHLHDRSGGHRERESRSHDAGGGRWCIAENISPRSITDASEPRAHLVFSRLCGSPQFDSPFGP